MLLSLLLVLVSICSSLVFKVVVLRGFLSSSARVDLSGKYDSRVLVVQLLFEFEFELEFVVFLANFMVIEFVSFVEVLVS